MSISQNFPATRPSLNLNFSKHQKLDPRVTFTRTTSGTRVNSDGLVEVVPAYEPRFDFDPVTGECLGLLVEESRTNLVTYSENIDFYDEPSGYQINVATNTTPSPDGNSTADSFLGTGVSGRATLQYTTPPLPTDTKLCCSVFIKPINGFDQVTLETANYSGWADTGYIKFDLSTKEILEDTVQGGGIIEYPNGWLRIYLISTTNSNGTARGFYVNLIDSVVQTNEGVYLWGAQIEAGAFPTSYIPTSGSTVTRTADNASIIGTNFSSWYNNTEGTVYADTKINGVQTGRYDRLWAITNSNLNFEGISIYVAGPSGTPSGYTSSVTITNSATEQVGGTLVETALTTPRLKSVFAFKQNDCASAYNGQQRLVDSIVDLSSFTTPLDRLLIGQPQRFQGHSCMTISQLTYYPTRLPNAQLQTLTK